MTIQAAQAAVSQCPSWCAADIPSHISAEQVVVATSGPERVEIYVSLEQEPGLDAAPAVRVQGAGDAPMSPEQAIQLGLALIANGVAALTTWQVSR